MTDDWKNHVVLGVERLVDDAAVNGAKREEVFDAVISAIEKLRLADERDPDPAEDDSVPRDPEPANDWPAAER